VTSAEKRDERRFQWNVALLGLAAVVASSVFAVLGTLWVTHQQISAQRDDDQADFLRTERRVAYGKVAAADDELRLAEARLGASTLVNPDPEPVDIRAAEMELSSLQEANLRLVSVGATVSLVGSRGARDATQDLVDAHSDFYIAINDLVAARGEVVNGGMTDALSMRIEKALADLANAMSVLPSAQGKFVTEARADLELSD
jgi:hypothetical protein